ncbi:hypothetical protein CDL12_27743 [Handroanthus impetiginosus]|uniref:F-box domain-containing protein n=1 Tax=Handroanthus impetiginosus TaxID=429701 RepID=A0A2G9G391_9LAMI|nr:hypothetical protein CDL12_27743 [Handroanthus impetiginosus]
MPILPFELIEDILCRLPVKSLKRFRAVAKSCCFLIDSKNFTKLHLQQSLVTNSNRHLILGGHGLYNVDLDLLDNAHVIKPPFYYKSFDGICNSCNGIVLVMSEPPGLWNPFSREYKILPNCSDQRPTPLESYSKTVHGFGYDSRNDDYKVVRVVEFRHILSNIWLSSETMIYSLKANSWRRIEDFPYRLPLLRGNWGVHVNGSLHTVVEKPDDMGAPRIMAFSLQTEKHYEVMIPRGSQIRGYDVSTHMIEGCLCLVCTNRSGVVIWIMKEYGVEESWIMLLSVSRSTLEYNHFVKPLAYSRDGDKVLLNCDEKRLVWYDLRTEAVDNVSVDGLPFVFYAEVCVESLVSLNGRDEVKKQRQEKKEGKTAQV